MIWGRDSWHGSKIVPSEARLDQSESVAAQDEVISDSLGLIDKVMVADVELA